MPMLAGGFAAGLIWIGFQQSPTEQIITNPEIQTPYFI
jgi:hypothetical protein